DQVTAAQQFLITPSADALAVSDSIGTVARDQYEAFAAIVSQDALQGLAAINRLHAAVRIGIDSAAVEYAAGDTESARGRVQQLSATLTSLRNQIRQLTREDLQRVQTVTIQFEAETVEQQQFMVI